MTDAGPSPAQLAVRPALRRKSSRKIPGGFGTDDDDDLSPTKPSFFDDDRNDDHNDDSRWHDQQQQAQGNNHNTRGWALSLGKLPALPPGGVDSSVLSAGEHSEGHLDSVDEREMRRHLMDVESSFLSAPSPMGQGRNPGVDDTFLFDGATNPSATKAAGRNAGMRTPARVMKTMDEADDESYASQSTYKTPGMGLDLTGQEEDSMVDNIGNTTSSLETMSSPSADAAARTVSRAISMVSMGYDVEGHVTGGYDAEGQDAEGQYAEGQDAEGRDAGGYVTANDASAPQSSNGDAEEEEHHDMPRILEPELLDGPIGDSSDERSTIRYHGSNQSLNATSADAGSTPGAALRSSSRRPKFLRSRHGSQRSSVSSFVTNPDAEEHGDMTYGTDYAMLSGGAVPTGGTSRNGSHMLSRTISLGSMASGIDDSTEPKPLDSALETLDEEERNRARGFTGDVKAEVDSDVPVTPRPPTHSLAAPTDTIIARHVRNVHVPESVAKEYRNKSGILSGNSLGISGRSTERHGKNLTLKEQSSTIERLSKENFDLKLKVMFLSDRLDKLSEEGVKEMISENVELKTVLANMQRDNKGLKRKIKELEQKNKDKDDPPRPDTARSGVSSIDRAQWFDQEGAQEREEEVTYLRERIEEYDIEIEKMRTESLNRESEKRKLAEIVRSMGEKRGEDMDAREEMDVWKDLLEQETARREQSDEDNRKLRDELFRIKSESALPGGASGMNHTTNIYNITKKGQGTSSRPQSRSQSAFERTDDRGGSFSAASTLVEQLREESEQLRHENAELRREVGAQTSMLTSRNREKERLYQEIEDLKLGHRRGSVTGDSILERSASRAHQRSHSKGSGATRTTSVVPDAEHEDLENKNAELRDKLNGLKMENQELLKELESCMGDFEIAIEAKREAEGLSAELQHELQSAESDLQTMQADRDEALKGQEDVEIEFENLRKEAQEEIDALEAEGEQRMADMESLQAELANQSENFNALQAEMRTMSEGVVRLEDDHDLKTRRIQELEHDLEEGNRELNEMEKAINEANNKLNRMTVQQESSQGEIAFLREEQDGDKIKIGDLESAIKNAENAVRDERERVREIEQRLADERHQRDLIAGKEKQEVQKYINDLNREASGAKDESRRLRKSLTMREVEATEWKERLLELENNLREALGDLNGTRSSFLKGIGDLQKQLDNTTRELDITRTSTSEKDRIIKQRDTLLETHGLESRKLSEMLDKERQSHRNTKHQHETFLKTHHHAARTISQQETRVIQLETALQHDRKKLIQHENSFKDQMLERNNLLLALWDRLSLLCGSDWAHNNSLINGRALPSLEAVATMLPGFSKNLLAAVKALEAIIGGLKTRVRAVEKDLWREYQGVEVALDQRTKKLERLESLLKSAAMQSSTDQRTEIVRLQDMNRLLRVELAALRTATPRKPPPQRPPPDLVDAGSPSPSVPTGPRNKSIEQRSSRSSLSSLTRLHSAGGAAAEAPPKPPVMLDRTSSAGSGSGVVRAGGEDVGADQRWIFRLKELERRLKAEREARLLDRSGARKRLEEGERRNEELRAELERSRVRAEAETALR